VTTLTKTLELKLVEPNAHKRKTPRDARRTNRRFTTPSTLAVPPQTEANDVVVNYKLVDAKRMRSKLRPATHDDVQRRRTSRCPPRPFHERRATTRPQARERYRVVRQNPAPRGLPPLDASTTESRTTGLVGSVERRRRHDGRSRLFRRDGTWYLHVTATRDAGAVPRCPTKNGHPSVSILGSVARHGVSP